MGANLANALKKYYTKESNGRIIFQNGRTLSDVAWEIWELLEYREIEVSVLSRVLKGDRSLSTKQLEVFCKVIGLTDRERWEVEHALYQDFCLKYDLDIDFSISSSLLQLAIDYSTRIYQVGMQGNPQLALEIGTFASDWIQKITRKESSSWFYQELLRIYSEVLYHLSTSYHEFALRREVVSITEPIIDEMREIAKRIGDKELFGLANLSSGVSYYLADNNVVAIRLLTRAIGDIKNPTHKLRTYRALASSYANLGDKRQFELSEEKGKQIIGDGYATEDRICEALGGFGRARAKLGLPKVLETLEEAQQIHKSIETKEKAPFLKVQLMRSRVDVINCLMPEEKTFLETEGNRAIALARNNGYKRYELIIQELLNSSLNSTGPRFS